MLDDLPADAPLRVVMNVRPAHTHRFDLQQHIARPLQDRHWPLTNFQVPYAGENRNFHLLSTPPIGFHWLNEASGQKPRIIKVASG
jgi:hypothetical protein